LRIERAAVTALLADNRRARGVPTPYAQAWRGQRATKRLQQQDKRAWRIFLLTRVTRIFQKSVLTEIAG
jgi:hypothetical protein